MKKLLSALLIATLLIASVACIFAVAEEGDTTEPIATLELNSGAIYSSEPPKNTVLAAIGENKTIGEITAYLLSSSAKDYNYFYVYAVVDGVVTAEYETLGREPAEGPNGLKTDVEVPEGGVLVCLHAGDESVAALNEQINVGCTVVFENVTVEALAALEPGQNIEGAKVSFYAPVEPDDDDDNTTSDDGDDTTTDDGDDTTTDDGDDTTTTDDSNVAGGSDVTDDSNAGGTNTESTATESVTSTSSDSPATGDNNGMIIFAVLAVVALAGGIVVIRARG